MNKRPDRRQVLKGATAACAALLLPGKTESAVPGLRIAGQDAEIQVAPVSAHTARLTILLTSALEDGRTMAVAGDGSLVQTSWGAPIVKLRIPGRARTAKMGNLIVKVASDPVAFTIETLKGRRLQHLSVDKDTGVVSFSTGDSPLLGLGEGGPQFDRRRSTDRMRSGQGGFQLRTHGGRVPIPWLIGTAGWAMFIHQPFGTFDFTGAESKFQPAGPHAALPLDIFFVAASEPATIMAEYARLTGYAEMPPLWSFGYQQSHRTLASREEIIAEAKTFREKKLPCDTLIYLGTGFCPSGWNTENGSFSWNRRVFPDPKQAIEELHREHFHVVLHSVILENDLRGTVRDPCNVARFDKEQASCAWDAHRKTFALGVDGWWPDEGDPLNSEARLARNRMYWEGPQLDRPDERPYALHR